MSDFDYAEPGRGLGKPHRYLYITPDITPGTDSLEVQTGYDPSGDSTYVIVSRDGAEALRDWLSDWLQRDDSKVAYSEFATTKEEMCADCAVTMLNYAGERITRGDALLAWIERNADCPEAVEGVNICPCRHPNSADAAVSAVTASVEGEDDRR